MLNFYKKAFAVLCVLLLLSGLIAYWTVQRTFSFEALLPAPQSGYLWQAVLEDDASQAGESTVRIVDDHYSLEFALQLSDVAPYPYAGLALNFVDPDSQTSTVDLTPYNKVSFSVKCSPANVLGFSASTLEAGISKVGEPLTYRSPASYFACDDQWSSVTIDLTRLETPQWWLEAQGLKLSMTEYQLDEVVKLVFGSSYQSPMGVASRVQINNLTLQGRDWRYLYLLAALLLAGWLGAIVWLWREHTLALTRALKIKLQKDRPLVAYQQLSIEPTRDREKDALLRYLATEYANSELNLDTMVKDIGVSRTKINDILKAELGFTFTSYLNKVRLTEAARLLSSGGESSIAEIAYSVGYRNVSYFNKLFKDEYGCTPKVFKNIYQSK
ncbi:helix-turn-helix domain-containing protein [Gilvimarinus algae]|uniref:AraC family transcriptional regulator n=1 Tax=Gilvimarinus algae TaxID=3058037 RepID=A0ABT8TB51_9GAMM|nr:AraC family transcriptional regulator [Gilvimarinus sp. SDUM040014]MDO3381243.1 AraC family transcriptional regulator [Gilvimarinus sp. SDUM040014]